MEEVWKSFFYNENETNIEVTKCGKVRRINVAWMKRNTKTGEVDFTKMKLNLGYYSLCVQIKGLKQKNIFVHQLIASAFLGYKFQGHKQVVDHIDSNKLNNHKDNLRVISHRKNISKEKTIKSGLPTGVWFYKKRGKYRAQIRENNIIKHLGEFNTIEEASQAYQNKLKTLCI